MKVVAHHDVTDELPLAAADRPLQSVEQSASIRIIADNPLPGVAPRYHVLNGARNSIRTRRGMPGVHAVNGLIVHAKTKNKS
jgi:hypothetical protein